LEHDCAGTAVRNRAGEERQPANHFVREPPGCARDEDLAAHSVACYARAQPGGFSAASVA